MLHFIQKFSQASSKVGLFSKYFLALLCWGNSNEKKDKSLSSYVYVVGERVGKIQISKIFNTASGKFSGEL